MRITGIFKILVKINQTYVYKIKYLTANNNYYDDKSAVIYILGKS